MGSQTIFYANFKPSKTTRPRRFFKLIISAFPATVLIVCTGYLSPKDASLNYFGSLHALLSLNNLLIFLIFCQSDTHVNHSDSCTLVFSFINLFLQVCLLVALFLTRLHVCGISLPFNLRSSPSLMNSRKLLKTHLYHKHLQS